MNDANSSARIDAEVSAWPDPQAEGPIASQGSVVELISLDSYQ